MKSLKVLSYFILICWSLAGIITMGSIWLSKDLWFINFFVGLFFLFIGFYFLQKERYFLKLCNQPQINEKILTKNIKLELMLVLGFSFFGVIVLSAVYSRVFNESFAVFG